ncbi:MAG: bifunctional 4-hydroxy-2-oxoglutarate aldolase/2-dehydro-3-deoxy-phosphogluconate aldolase [Oscillospiraceae bacterium]|jgi:2-dehydro-3-deoxyphosphogluconate aldolase/(4S)-4-hydroxy-2-oxoglutarate aldolase|nr:bifunctional 4-hydroxy-2-oxoglutarate aldolase/2-dehydro-3-deoxy-phosphogluconate aldolase [Oscillospiraceae bacterium]
MREEVIAHILEGRIIAIARGVKPELQEPLAEALLAGGISLLELTFDQSKPESFEANAEAIRNLSEKYKGHLRVGAGTVMSPKEVQLCAEAGGEYIISPNADEAVIKETRKLGLVSIPGVMTPTECALAHSWGADFMKVFPAGVLGAGYIKAIAAPLKHLKFLAVGAISEENMAEFVKVGVLGFGMGGNLVNQSWLANGEADKITALARRLMAISKG